MFKVAKKLRSSLIRNSSKSFVVSPLIRKCAVRAICIGNLSNDVYVFFRALLLRWNRRKQKQGGKNIIREAVRKMEKSLIIIIVAFLSGLCLIGQDIPFRHFQNIYLENYWRQSLIWYLARPCGQDVSSKFFINLL